MKCAVAIVLALIGLVVTNPVPPLGLGIGAPVYYRSSVVNHGITVPIARHVVAAPVVTSVVPAGLGWGGWGGYGLGDWGGYGLGGWGGYGHGGWGGLGYKG